MLRSLLFSYLKALLRMSVLERGGTDKSTYLRRATEGGSCAVVFNVLLAEPKVSKDNVSL